MSNRNIKIAIFSTLALLLLLGSTVAASANDLPGEPLYPVKLAAENATLALTFSDEAKASKLLNMATERVAELEGLEDDPDKTADEELIDETEEILAEELDDLAEIGGSVSDDNKNAIILKLQALDVRHDAVMARVYEQVPEQAKPSIQKAMENSKRGHARAIEALSKEHGKDNAPGHDASKDVDKDPGSTDADDASDDADDQDPNDTTDTTEVLDPIDDDDDSDDNDPAKDEEDQDHEDVEEGDDEPSSNGSSNNNGNGKSDNSNRKNDN